MTVSLLHATQSAVSDEAAAGNIKPSHWNAQHTLSMDTGKMLGRTTNGSGSVEEIAVGGGLALAALALSLADTGVTAGTYSYPTITVDAKGRITLAQSGINPADAVAAALAAQAAAEDAQTAAETAQGLAEAALDSFDDIYLGSKAADPTLDNDGNALVEGQLYWNSSSNALRVYDGAAWQAYPAGLLDVVDDTTPQLGGALDLNSQDITGTGNIDITGDVTASGDADFGDATTGLHWDAATERLALGGLGTTFTFAGIGPVGVDLAIHNDESGEVCQGVFRYSATANESACWLGLRSRGTIAAPTVVQNNDILASITALGFDGTDYEFAAQILVEVDGTPGNNDMPGRILFLTTPDGAQAPVEALRLDSDQVATFANTPLVGANAVLDAGDIGSSVQAWDAQLDSLSAASADGVSLVTAANYAAMAELLGVGPTDSPEFTAIELGHASDTTLARDSAGWLAVEGNVQARRTPVTNAQTGTTYTLALVDTGAEVMMDNGSSNTVTIPTNASIAFPVGTVLVITQIGAGVTTVDGDTGVTVNGVSGGGAAILARYQGVSLRKIATDSWVMSGAHGAVA